MSDAPKKTVIRRAVVTEEQKKKYLVGNTPPYLGKPFELPDGDFSIGREEGRDLQIVSDMISRHHATISQKDGQHILTDNQSSNGTILNNNPLPAMTPKVLNHLDVLKFDVFEFIFIDTARADLWETLKPLSREGAQIISFYSPKGGTGLSSIVVNLAYQLSVGAQKKTAVADLDLRFGDILTYSMGKPGLTIHDVVQDPNTTGETIGKFLQAGNGYNFLPAPVKTEYAELIRPEHVKKILWSLEAKHDHVLVDLKHEIDDVSLTSWEVSNLIFLVANPEIGHMLALRKILDIMNQFKYPESKVRVLINRLGREGTLTSEEIKTFLKRDFVTLPYAPADAILSSHSGQLYAKERPDCALSKALANLAKGIRGEKVEVVEGGIFGRLKSLLGF